MHTIPIQLSLPAARQARLERMRHWFPQATGPDVAAHWQGGRAAGLAALHKVDVADYARSRNYLNGKVSRLSPYLRHGCLTSQEVSLYALEAVGARAEKFVSEVAYRDFFRQAWYRFQASILQDMEPAKVLLGNRPLPADLQAGRSGVLCMDAVVKQLEDDGYVHNHARMWFAAYVLHWLKVDWRQAADWFEQQLLDGDLASNHLSWQWVGSTFSHKPYFFNRENLQRFAGDQYCKQCKAQCPFDDSYEALQQQLFIEVDAKSPGYPKARPLQQALALTPRKDLPLWVHDEMLSSAHALLHTQQPKVFIFDPALYGHWPLKRLQWMADALAEMPDVQVWSGPTAQVWQHLGIAHVQSQRTPQSKLHAAISPIKVTWCAEPPFAEATLSDHHLMRFTRYWKKVGPTVLGAYYRG